jgi:hypothetical protein
MAKIASSLGSEYNARRSFDGQRRGAAWPIKTDFGDALQDVEGLSLTKRSAVRLEIKVGAPTTS